MTFTILLTLLKLEITCLAGGGPLHLTKKLILENNGKAFSWKEKGGESTRPTPKEGIFLCLSSGLKQLMIAMNAVTHKIGNQLKM